YGKKDPSLGWRFTDAWLSMAGNGDRGIPNGKPVDEWGIRMEGCRPTGSSIERGGDTNGPAAVYAITKYVEWLKKYAPPEAAGLTLRAVLRLEDHQPEEEPCRAHIHPRERHLAPELHRTRAEARRAGGVLPFAGADPVDADRGEYPRLPQAGAALVAEHRRRL